MNTTFAEFCCSDLRASLSGKDVPEDIKQRMLALHEENVSLKEQYKTAQEKLVKAKAVRAVLLSRIPWLNSALGSRHFSHSVVREACLTY